MNRTIATLGRRLRLGVIGGGPGSFIGPVHRASARLDDNYEIVASVLSSNPDRSRAEGRALGIDPDRAYGSAAEMFEAEGSRSDGMEVVAIMTPNDGHYQLSVMALERKLDILCDKPLTTSLDEAMDLAARVKKAGIVFCQTFNYTGFPMVRQARAMVRDGDLGEVRMVHVEYVQGHNAALTEAEATGNWHFKPERVGASLILGDIGSHAHHMASFVSCQAFAKVSADVGTVVPGRNAHDYAGINFRLANGAPGALWVTQAGAGAVHGLHFRVFCERGGLEWFQETPNQLFHSRLGAPALTFERGGPGLKPEALRSQRIGIGHPEGYQEAFAVLYADVAEVIVARKLGRAVDPLALDFPTVEDGVRTMKFIAATVESSDKGGGWVDARVGV
ncbi:MAG: Gfo/Idh/MocA family oxidoreductase [Rhizobiales bacterium]|nr:Gfo/Idh/MocA family oxidoreductase [Hyphomicrobiales bacterium]